MITEIIETIMFFIVYGVSTVFIFLLFNIDIVKSNPSSLTPLFLVVWFVFPILFMLYIWRKYIFDGEVQ